MKLTCGFLLLFWLVGAGSAEAQLRPRIWISGAAAALNINGQGGLGTGYEQLPFDLQESYLKRYTNSDFKKVGLAWDSKAMLGYRLCAGLNFNDRLGIRASYCRYNDRKADEVYFDTDGFEEVTFSYESRWSQEAWQLLIHYYIESNSFGFYLLGGLERVTLALEGAESIEYFDGFTTDLDSAFWSGDAALAAPVFGFGYEPAPLEWVTLFGNFTYSLAKYDGTQMLGGEHLEVKIGGVSVDVGVKAFLW